MNIPSEEAGPPPESAPTAAATAFIAASEDAGLRLDRFLAALLPKTSRRLLGLLFEKGGVCLNDRPAAKGTRVRPGDRITVFFAETTPRPAPDLTVLYEDEELIAVDKPAGIPTHPLAPGEGGTALDGIVALVPGVATAGPDPREGGLLHRLDNDTSGVLLAAKTGSAWEVWHCLFRGKAAPEEDGFPTLVEKTYLALVLGEPPEETWAPWPIAHAAGDVARNLALFGPDETPLPWAGRVVGRTRGRARSAESRFSVVERFPGAALVRVRLQSAVTHQVRVHLAALGHPIAGDPLYRTAAARAADATGIMRTALHAESLTCSAPETGHRLTIRAPLAPDIEACLRKLRGS